MTQSIYSARWVLPIDAEPIENGRVVVEDGTIVDVGPARRTSNSGRDFGNAVIMPGFVNAHTHLEYTVQRGLLEDEPFFPWIRALTASKSRIDEAGWLVSTRLGALETVAAGITTIGDNTDAGATPRVAAECGLRAVIFQEVFGIDDSEPVNGVVEALLDKLVGHQRYRSHRVSLGVSPHALYTVRPAVFAALNANTITSTLPWSIHVAESTAETDLTLHGRGPFMEMYGRRGITWTPPMCTPTAYANEVGALGRNTLAVHCVHQTAEDIDIVGRSEASIVHCPKSNGKLGAGIAPLAEWLKAGLSIGLGTDSAVSNNTLDMFEEMRFAVLAQRARTHDVLSVSAKDVLTMATLGGARCLSVDKLVGSLAAGKRADLIVVRLDQPHTAPVVDVQAALVYSARAADVIFTLCDGVVLYIDGAWPTMNKAEIMAECAAVRRTLENKTIS